MFADPGHEKTRIFRTLDTISYFGNKIRIKRIKRIKRVKRIKRIKH